MRQAVAVLAGSVCGSARGNVHWRMKRSLWDMCKKLIFKEILFFFFLLGRGKSKSRFRYRGVKNDVCSLFLFKRISGPLPNALAAPKFWCQNLKFR